MSQSALPTGVYTAALSPLHEDLSCNCEALADHCIDLIKRGCQGIVLFGTTGEGPSFSAGERIEILKKVIQLGVDPQCLMIGTTSCALDESVQLARSAMEQGCLALLVAPPCFYKNIDDAGLTAFYRELIQRVDHPKLKILLYHIPQYSGVPITLPVIKALRDEFPATVVGMKESQGNLDLIRTILSTFADFKVFAGVEVQIVEAVQLGAVGAISGIANGYPELICSLYKCGKDPQKSNATELVASLLKLLKNYPLFPAIKSLVEMEKGAAWHLLRPPLRPLDAKSREELRQAVSALFSS